ncbi:MAG: xanthine dehydrogenase family protein molybdopterin-binding subunit [Nitrososphaerales archaeon]
MLSEPEQREIERKKWIGKPMKRLEDQRLITADTAFVDDLEVSNVLYVAVLRSPYAHAKLLSVNTSKALELSGVVAAISGADAKAHTKTLPAYAVSHLKPEEYGIAVGKVRYVGEPVAAVAAVEQEIAEDALELIEVEYEPLTAVVNVEEAMKPDAPLVYDSFGTNVVAHHSAKWGKVEQAFKDADFVFKKRVTLSRFSSTPLESVAIIGRYDSFTDELTLSCNAQMPGHVMMVMSEVLGIPTHNLHLIVNDIGGGFGLKTRPWKPLVIVSLLAKKVPNRHIKYIEDRREHLMASGQTAGMVADFEVAANKEGKILAFRLHDVNNDGASLTYAGTYSSMHATLINGCYGIRNIEWDSYTVLTNTCPSMPNRGVGKPGIVYIVERMVDLVSKKLGIDPSEVRFRNFIQPDRFPYVTPSGRVYDSGNYPEVLRRALKISDYDKWRRDQSILRKQGRFIGIGIAVYVHGASATAREIEGITVKMDPKGRVSVSSGSPDMGTSHSSAFSQILADELGIQPDDVKTLSFDSDRSPWTPYSGTHANKFSGPDVESAVRAARILRHKMLVIASHLLGVPERENEIILSNRKAFLKSAPEKFVSVSDIAKASYQNPQLLPKGIDPGLEATAVGNSPFAMDAFNSSSELETGATHQLVTGSSSPTGYMTYPNSAHVVVIEVDPETGGIKILNYAIVHDVGRVINPMIVEGQVHGGAISGIGAALLEEFLYGDDGELLSSSFMDYLKPTSLDAPNIVEDRIETPSPRSSLGIKAIGEGESLGPLPALCNAVEDALCSLEIEVPGLPMTPERIKKLIDKARSK